MVVGVVSFLSAILRSARPAANAAVIASLIGMVFSVGVVTERVGVVVVVCLVVVSVLVEVGV